MHARRLRRRSAIRVPRPIAIGQPSRPQALHSLRPLAAALGPLFLLTSLGLMAAVSGRVGRGGGEVQERALEVVAILADLQSINHIERIRS